MAIVVSNPTADSAEKIQHAAHILKNSSQALEVFNAVYSGRQDFKSIEEIGAKVKNFNRNTSNAASRLANEGIVTSKKVAKRILYGKDGFYTHNRNKILSLSANPARLKTYPTKRNQTVTVKVATHNVKFLTKPQAEQIYIDDVASFSEVLRVKKGTQMGLHDMAERTVNKGICEILGQGEKSDWGGEKNDIFGSIMLNSKRVSAAFALKGKATKGQLVPKKVGSNGDQVQRLFESTAQAHFIVYHSRVAESIYDLMQSQAVYKSVVNGNKKIYFCVIDGDDLNRLITAYPTQFGVK